MENNYSHFAHCQHQVEIACEVLRGSDQATKQQFIMDHCRRLIEGYTDTVYKGIDFAQVSWARFVNRLWKRCKPDNLMYSGDDEGYVPLVHKPEDRAKNLPKVSGKDALPDDVRIILMDCAVEGLLVKLPPRQLERKLYEKTKQALEEIGGKWNTSKQGFVFRFDPAPKIQEMLERGSRIREKQKFQAFFTPKELARQVAEKALVRGMDVLEPSAGYGALADACKEEGAAKIHCLDINEECISVLKEKGYIAVVGDFLDNSEPPRLQYDRVVMNPPFTKDQDVKHVRHALQFLKPGGRLVAIMGGNTTRKRFQELVNETGAEVEEIPAGAFKESGTGVATVLVTIQI